ncbi:MAG: hypothetical protein HGB10_08850 [Coriobacteriia bacterium]|nr:hypothetical protein [Coriobacteriia bacterium]
MVRMIGNAEDFWRIRVTRVDTTENFDFEWHDDILYREPQVDPGDEVEFFHVEAVRLDDPDIVTRMATFDEPGQARALLDEARDALSEMTKSQFEAAYLQGAQSGNTGTE